jgi:hypothetical protein
LVDGAGRDEPKVAELLLKVNGFRLQLGMSDRYAVVVGPAHVGGLRPVNRSPAKLGVALVEDLDEVGLHQPGDHVGHSMLLIDGTGVALAGVRPAEGNTMSACAKRRRRGR